MCGRYTLGRSTRDILERYVIQQNLFALSPRHNIAPSQMVPVILSVDGSRVLDGLKWGLIPFWVKDLSKAKPLINARAETLAEKPSFKQALARRRCLIPADGFYEWKGEGPSRTPMHIRLRGAGLFSFAGLFEEWKAPDGDVLRTCAIITVEPNRKMSEIHNRMPAMLRQEDEDLWLNAAEKDPAQLLRVLKPYPDDEMEIYPVSRKVNSPAFDDPACIEPDDGRE